MIDVEQDALRALEQDARAGLADFLQALPDGLRIFEHIVGDFGEVGDQLLAVDRRLAETGAQRIVVRGQAVELRVELVEVRKVADADRTAADLVLIGGADAAPGGADLACARGVSRSASRSRWNGRISAQLSAIAKFSGLMATPWPRSFGDLVAQRPRVEDDAVADDRERAGDDARGKQRQLVDLFADDERMAGIVTALEADHGVGAAGEPVDDLALALVAPLRPDDGNICHDECPAVRGPS